MKITVSHALAIRNIPDDRRRAELERERREGIAFLSRLGERASDRVFFGMVGTNRGRRVAPKPAAA